MILMKLVKRNILVYSRDRANIFFSLLSMLIIIGLMLVFLGNMNANEVVELLQTYGGVRDTISDKANADQLIFMWSLAGIVVVNSITITLSMIGIMVEDEDRNRLSSFYVSPINRGILVLGYIIAAFLVGVIICCLTVAIPEFYVGMTGGTLLTLEQFIKIFGFILLTVFSSACMVFLISTFVHSTSAFSGLSTIIGTLVGFLSAIYLPMGMLPANVQNALKCFPLLHGCSLMRELFTEQAMAVTFKNCPDEIIKKYKEYMGMTISWDGNMITDEFKVAFLIICGIVCIGISAFLLKKRNTVVR
jgi:ABC-2 type transporter.